MGGYPCPIRDTPSPPLQYCTERVTGAARTGAAPVGGRGRQPLPPARARPQTSKPRSARKRVEAAPCGLDRLCPVARLPAVLMWIGLYLTTQRASMNEYHKRVWRRWEDCEYATKAYDADPPVSKPSVREPPNSSTLTSRVALQRHGRPADLGSGGAFFCGLRRRRTRHQAMTAVAHRGGHRNLRDGGKTTPTTSPPTRPRCQDAARRRAGHLRGRRVDQLASPGCWSCPRPCCRARSMSPCSGSPPDPWRQTRPAIHARFGDDRAHPRLIGALDGEDHPGRRRCSPALPRARRPPAAPQVPPTRRAPAPPHEVGNSNETAHWPTRRRPRRRE